VGVEINLAMVYLNCRVPRILSNILIGDIGSKLRLGLRAKAISKTCKVFWIVFGKKGTWLKTEDHDQVEACSNSRCDVFPYY